MKSEKIKTELENIHMELAYIRGMLENVGHQMQELQQTIRESSNKDEMLRVREHYEHPWYKYKRQELITDRNYTESKRKETSIA